MANNDLLVLKNKEVLVTGGCGFIGSEIVKQLSLIGANVTIIDNLSSGKEKYIEGISNVKLVTGDLLDDDVIYLNYMMELSETYDELNDIPFSNIKNLVLDLNTFHVM